MNGSPVASINIEKRGKEGKGQGGNVLIEIPQDSKTLVIKYNAKPMLCYSSQCYHCLFSFLTHSFILTNLWRGLAVQNFASREIIRIMFYYEG